MAIMTTNDLKNGDLVTTVNGNEYQVLIAASHNGITNTDNIRALMSVDGHAALHLWSYNTDFKNRNNHEYDIVKVSRNGEAIWDGNRKLCDVKDGETFMLGGIEWIRLGENCCKEIYCITRDIMKYMKYKDGYARSNFADFLDITLRHAFEFHCSPNRPEPHLMGVHSYFKYRNILCKYPVSTEWWLHSEDDERMSMYVTKGGQVDCANKFDLAFGIRPVVALPKLTDVGGPNHIHLEKHVEEAPKAAHGLNSASETLRQCAPKAFEYAVRQIAQAKNDGRTSEYICSHNNVCPIETIMHLLDIGYDIRFSFFEHDHTYIFKADWSDSACGKIYKESVFSGVIEMSRKELTDFMSKKHIKNV